MRGSHSELAFPIADQTAFGTAPDSNAASAVNEIVIDDGVFTINATSGAGIETGPVTAKFQTSVSSMIAKAGTFQISSQDAGAIETAVSYSAVSMVGNITIE
jgi:hypothetical protein